MPDPDPEVIAVRAEERLDLQRLEPYLREGLGERDAPLQIAQFGGGHANLTYLIAFGEREYVLRRPPLGPVPAHAHDMRREHAVLSRLYATFPLAPRSLLLCTDHAILGVDFVVEERKHGIAIRRDLPPQFRDDPALARRIGEMLVDTLAALHGVDAAAAGLSDLGKPEGYVERQLDGWIRRWEAARTERTPAATELIAWLRERLPRSPAATIVHNDYKLDNMLVDPADPARVTALLDWDMCTLGDPLMDLGYLLALWPQAEDPPMWRNGSMPTWRPGFPTRAEATERYARRTGFDVGAVHWYYLFSIFRFAAILQQIYARFERGQTSDERFRGFGEQAAALVAAAGSEVRRGGE
ncbi:MAG TPA: phosphotransferase family protein [Verrucomicrobiae bacterium]|nr:phosphotransferase family protein [Verrucomicrobiae bacterium]